MTLKSLLQKAAAKNAAASYLAFASSALWGLASIPLAVTYLKPEQIGLWAIVNALLGYLAWGDLGIGPAIGRIMAPSISKGDQIEMNRWWTVSRVALFILGIIVIAIGILLCLAIEPITQCSEEVIGDARLLLGGGAAILGLTFPIRGVAGILIAEHRYHWAPLVQAASPWINFFVFFMLLKMGHGIKAYLFAFVASQSFNWVCFKILISKGPNQFSWDKNGIRISRFRELFTFSSNIAITGGVDSIMHTMPNLLLAQLANLTIVPIYQFSSRAVFLITNLVEQTVRSFYPGLQRLFINDEKEQFRQRHQQVCIITISLAIIGAAAVLILNEPVVQLLAGDRYYVGSAANTWLAASLITSALSTLYRILLPISGDMGKAAIIATIKIPIAIILSIICWQYAGITGVAAAFAIIPLIDGIYAAYRGSINCGYKPFKMHCVPASIGMSAIILTWLGGFWVNNIQTEGPEITIGSRQITMPSPQEILPAAVLATAGSLIGARQLIILSRGNLSNRNTIE